MTPARAFFPYYVIRMAYQPDNGALRGGPKVGRAHPESIKPINPNPRPLLGKFHHETNRTRAVSKPVSGGALSPVSRTHETDTPVDIASGVSRLLTNYEDRGSFKAMEFSACVYLKPAPTADTLEARYPGDGQTVCVNIMVWAPTIAIGSEMVVMQLDPDGSRGAAVSYVRSWDGPHFPRANGAL